MWLRRRFRRTAQCVWYFKASPKVTHLSENLLCFTFNSLSFLFSFIFLSLFSNETLSWYSFTVDMMCCYSLCLRHTLYFRHACDTCATVLFVELNRRWRIVCVLCVEAGVLFLFCRQRFFESLGDTKRWIETVDIAGSPTVEACDRKKWRHSSVNSIWRDRKKDWKESRATGRGEEKNLRFQSTNQQANPYVGNPSRGQ